MPNERTRALVWAGAFLIELERDDSLPLWVRQRAVQIARHYPTIEKLALLVAFARSSGLDLDLDEPDPSWTNHFKHGALTHVTNLRWPEE